MGDFNDFLAKFENSGKEDKDSKNASGKKFSNSNKQEDGKSGVVEIQQKEDTSKNKIKLKTPNGSSNNSNSPATSNTTNNNTKIKIKLDNFNSDKKQTVEKNKTTEQTGNNQIKDTNNNARNYSQNRNSNKNETFEKELQAHIEAEYRNLNYNKNNANQTNNKYTSNGRTAQQNNSNNIIKAVRENDIKEDETIAIEYEANQRIREQKLKKEKEEKESKKQQQINDAELEKATVERLFIESETELRYKEKWLEVYNKSKASRKKTETVRKILNGRFRIVNDNIVLISDFKTKGMSSSDLVRTSWNSNK